MIYDDGKIQLHQGDAIDVMGNLLNSGIKVSAIITDPPYASGGMHRNSRLKATVGKYVEANINAPLAGFEGDQRDQRGWAAWCYLWTSMGRQLTIEGGDIFSFIDWRQLPTLSDIVQMSGWVWQGIGVWHKGYGRPQKGRFSNGHEFVIHGINGKKEPVERYAPGVFHQATPKDKEHITQKPIETMEWLLKLIPPDGLILDPFAGSGTTLVAAKRLGIAAIGIESELHHCSTILKRLNKVNTEQ